MVTLSIVGTAGRKDDARKLSKYHFEAMCLCAETLLKSLKDTGYLIDTLVSGGAAWADHVAVKLYLQGKIENLILYLPTKYEQGQFDITAINDADRSRDRTTGETINYYHRKFSRVAGFNSFEELTRAEEMGAGFYVTKGGFFGRNAMVAKSDCILAMTFGNENKVKLGGTHNTVENYLKRVKKEGFFDKSFHYDLNSGNIYSPCLLSA